MLKADPVVREVLSAGKGKGKAKAPIMGRMCVGVSHRLGLTLRVYAMSELEQAAAEGRVRGGQLHNLAAVVR